MNQSTIRAGTLATAALMMLSLAAPAFAQSFGDRMRGSVERATESEVQRRADGETRRVVRCTVGDQRCIDRAQRQRLEVEILESSAAGAGPNHSPATAAPTGPDYQHPLIQPYHGSVLRWRDGNSVNQVAHDEYLRVIGYDADAREPVTQRVAGRVTRLVYDNPPGRSVFEILDNYRNALESQGAVIDWSCEDRRTCGSTSGWRQLNGFNNSVLSEQRYFTGILHQDGREVYFAIGGYRQRHTIHLVEVEAMDEGMVAINADALGSALDRDGRIALEGIYFDTGRSTLREESAPALEQVAQLLRGRSELRLAIVGHTDSAGALSANMTLSQERADAVRDALTSQHDIAAARLTAQGVGPAVPVASNDTEEGRARNRRVELVVP